MLEFVLFSKFYLFKLFPSFIDFTGSKFFKAFPNLLLLLLALSTLLFCSFLVVFFCLWGSSAFVAFIEWLLLFFLTSETMLFYLGCLLYFYYLIIRSGPLCKVIDFFCILDTSFSIYFLLYFFNFGFKIDIYGSCSFGTDFCLFTFRFDSWFL